MSQSGEEGEGVMRKRAAQCRVGMGGWVGGWVGTRLDPDRIATSHKLHTLQSIRDLLLHEITDQRGDCD